jgi:hypothetical protein
MHEEAFQQLGGVPKEIFYDRMRTDWQESMSVAGLFGMLRLWTARSIGVSRLGCAGHIGRRRAQRRAWAPRFGRS